MNAFDAWKRLPYQPANEQNGAAAPGLAVVQDDDTDLFNLPPRINAPIVNQQVRQELPPGQLDGSDDGHNETDQHEEEGEQPLRRRRMSAIMKDFATELERNGY